MRKPLIAANWKMHKTHHGAEEFVKSFLQMLSQDQGVEVLICPSFTSLESLGRGIGGSKIKLGAQNMHWEEKGAFTGEVSPEMLMKIGCSYVILGHSERRQIFGETDAAVNKKIRAAFNFGLIPLVCVGETLEEREAGHTKEKVKKQVEAALEGLEVKQVEKMVVAYEPIWAIGTGKTASAGDAQEVISYIREFMLEKSGAADKVRILYGGSVKSGNIAELMAQPDIDGALVGGASLEADSFAAIAGYKGL